MCVKKKLLFWKPCKVLYVFWLIVKIIFKVIGIACVAMIGSVGFDMVKHTVEIFTHFQIYKVVSGSSEKLRRVTYKYLFVGIERSVKNY